MRISIKPNWIMDGQFILDIQHIRFLSGTLQNFTMFLTVCMLMSHYVHADDTQLYVLFDPKIQGDLNIAVGHLQNCIADIKNWMTANKLKLNDSKLSFSSLHHHIIIKILYHTI